MKPEITKENYEQMRVKLLEENSNLHGLVLREKELRVDRYLSQIKKRYFSECGGKEKYDMPTLTDIRLQNSELYRFCTRLPKGADLHVHDMALLPAGELIQLLMTCPEFCINTDRRSFDLKTVPPEQPVPDGYARFREVMESGYYTDADLLQNWTVVGGNDYPGGIWAYFETLFERHDVLSGNPEFAAKYYNWAFRYYCRQNIQHVEIHNMLTDSIDESAEYVRTVRQAYYDVKKEYPYFTVRIIGAGVKADNASIDFTRKCFLNASYVQEVVKDESDPQRTADFVIGFDLVNEEDSSLPLHDFAPMLLKVKKRYPDMRLYIHGGESLEASNENLIDAYLLGVSRVGHGLNLYRYPDLHSRYVKAEICLEVCPISNQRLGYTKDIRNHPATEYLKTGMALALCSDDPAYMENQTLTDDFFAAIAGWDLNLADVKQLGINSIMYSGLDDEQKFTSLHDYNQLWNEFIDTVIQQTEENGKL